MSDHRTTPYVVLGLEPNASKEQVKEAFRKLCMTYHPDKQQHGGNIVAAEAKFRMIKEAYEVILKQHAGYSPPPPNSKASRYPPGWGSAQSAHEGGPLRTGGPYGGYRTEYDFYASGFRTSRNNPLLLILTGLVAIPVISTLTGLVTGESTWISRFRDEGIHGWSESKFRVNGRNTVALNPFSIKSLDNMGESYIYKGLTTSILSFTAAVLSDRIIPLNQELSQQV